MSWFKRAVGLDFFDVLLHAAVTMAGLVFFGVSDAPEELFPAGVAVSLVALGVRRHFALKKAAREGEGLTSGQMAALRLEEIEQRLAELDAAHARIAELEGRVEFAERLLSQASGERRLVGGGS
jgi:hypothetical protein